MHYCGANYPNWQDPKIAYNVDVLDQFTQAGVKMNPMQPILETACARGQDAQIAFAGIVTPQEALALLELDSSVKLIDVRTHAERDWVGKVKINEAQHIAVQWYTYPGSVLNPDFIAQLEAEAKPDQVLLFLCRSGVRSRHAAKLATEHGYPLCFDILQGFEGDKDRDGHRKTVNGWCHAGLPWIGA